MKREPFIWLQEDETEGAADCGCRVIDDDQGVRVILCPLHQAAPRMIPAFKEIADTAALISTGKVDARARIERIEWVARWALALAGGKRTP